MRELGKREKERIRKEDNSNCHNNTKFSQIDHLSAFTGPTFRLSSDKIFQAQRKQQTSAPTKAHEQNNSKERELRNGLGLTLGKVIIIMEL